MNARQEARALARWEGEGGRLQLARRDETGTTLETAQKRVEQRNVSLTDSNGATVKVIAGTVGGVTGSAGNMERRKA